MTADRFVFATCAPAVTGWLKREISQLYPELRVAFSRPGFVTWKGDAELARSIVARVSGVTLGRGETPEAIASLISGLLGERRAVLHVFDVDQDLEGRGVDSSGVEGSGSESGGVAESQRCASFRGELMRLLPDCFTVEPAAAGALVIDVMLRTGGDVPEPTWVGWHLQRADRPRRAGGVLACVPPAESPSRAYAKLVELLELAELNLKPGALAVEIGAAPGGGTLALLQRGCSVVAIDPAPLAAVVTEFRGAHGVRLQHLQLPAGEVQRGQLPRKVDLVVTDVNLAPLVSLRYVERICKLVGGPRQAVLMTLKVNDPRVEADLPRILEQAHGLGRRFGLSQLRAVHLPSQRHEVGVVLRAPGV